MQYRGKGKHDYLRRVEFAFYNEAAIRQAVREKRLDRGTKAAGARGGFSDPTASAAISASMRSISRRACSSSFMSRVLPFPRRKAGDVAQSR